MTLLKSAGYTTIPWIVATITDLAIGGWLEANPNAEFVCIPTSLHPYVAAHNDMVFGRRLAAALVDIDSGGVVLNLGSAVIMPEVFLKALTIARNLNDKRPVNFTTCNLDMQQHYRPRMNVVLRPTSGGGKGYEITGHHEIMVPMLTWAVIDRLEQSGAKPSR